MLLPPILPLNTIPLKHAPLVVTGIHRMRQRQDAADGRGMRVEAGSVAVDQAFHVLERETPVVDGYVPYLV